MLLRGGRREVLLGAPPAADTVGEGVEDDMMARLGNDSFPNCGSDVDE